MIILTTARFILKSRIRIEFLETKEKPLIRLLFYGQNARYGGFMARSLFQFNVIEK